MIVLVDKENNPNFQNFTANSFVIYLPISVCDDILLL